MLVVVYDIKYGYPNTVKCLCGPPFAVPHTQNMKYTNVYIWQQFQMGVNRHEEKTVAARSRVAALEKATALNPSLVSDLSSILYEYWTTLMLLSLTYVDMDVINTHPSHCRIFGNEPFLSILTNEGVQCLNKRIGRYFLVPYSICRTDVYRRVS